MTPPRPPSPQESKVRAKRIELPKQLVVESRTLGTLLTFAMPLDNVSRSGLLLSIGRNKKLPFQVNTLLEITVDPRGALFPRPVACIGKIVRTHSEQGDTKPRFGIQIVQIEAAELTAWERALDQIEGGAASGQGKLQLPAAI